MSILSASKIIGAVLNDKVGALVTKIFPVIAAESAQLPYICYYRDGLTQDPVKGCSPGACSAVIKILCLTSDYGEGVELAELIKEALDGRSWKHGELNMRICTLSDAKEYYADDAFVQLLIFNVKING